MNAQASAAAPARGVRRAAYAVFAATVIIAAGAFLITQRVKHLPTPIVSFEVGPSAHVPGGRERIALRLAAADTVNVNVVDDSGRVVATVARAVALTAQQQLVIRWDGREGWGGVHVVVKRPYRVRIHAILHGPLVNAGEYHATVHLQRLARTVPLPAYFVIER